MTLKKLARYMLILVSLVSIHGRIQAQTAVDGAISDDSNVTVEERTGVGVGRTPVVGNESKALHQFASELC